jgi:hypothetical protein
VLEVKLRDLLPAPPRAVAAESRSRTEIGNL